LKDASKPPREFSDYQDIVIPSDDQLPEEITITVIE
jgi:hypothetical protein